MNILAEAFDTGLSTGAFRIVDVREELEYQTFNLGGTNIPLGTLSREPDVLELDKEEPIVVLCQHGIRSQTACRILEQQGFRNVRNLNGGILAWRKLKQKKLNNDSY